LNTALVISFLRKDTRFTATSLLQALETGARRAAGLACVCAALGIIVGVFSLTGLGLTLSHVFMNWAGENHFTALFFVMCVSILLGASGLPALANYIVMSMMAAPVLIQTGIPWSAANMSIFYFSVGAELIPPTSKLLATSTKIASSDMKKTGILALRLAGAVFLIPYIFIN